MERTEGIKKIHPFKINTTHESQKSIMTDWKSGHCEDPAFDAGDVVISREIASLRSQ